MLMYYIQLTILTCLALGDKIKLMQRWRLLGRRGLLLVTTSVLLSTFAIVGVTNAQSSTSSSSNYQVTQTEFGSSSSAQNCSTSYCSDSSVGAVAGSTSSTSNTANFGSVTNSQPELAVIVEGGSSDLGVLSSSTTATKTMVVKVKNYLSSGYVMQIVGNPPTYQGHTLAAIPSPSTTHPGAEQFGINAVANTSPNVGANPVQVPSGSFSFGSITPNYSTPNLFMYASGETVAQSPKSSGETDYTISMIINISNATPAGQYAGDFSAVVIATY